MVHPSTPWIWAQRLLCPLHRPTVQNIPRLLPRSDSEKTLIMSKIQDLSEPRNESWQRTRLALPIHIFFPQLARMNPSRLTTPDDTLVSLQTHTQLLRGILQQPQSAFPAGHHGHKTGHKAPSVRALIGQPPPVVKTNTSLFFLVGWVAPDAEGQSSYWRDAQSLS